jgi:ATP-binding cassette subfamily F protein uup
MSSLIDVSNLSKSHGARILFADIRFSIEEGARIGLIGPNGAGKSTLLKILANQVEPDAGQIIRRKGLRVAMLEQQPILAKELDIRQNIVSALPDVHDSVALQYVDEVLSRFALDDYLKVPVATLSGGLLKRVALAREIAKQPDLLLLDEPTNHLDIESILWLESFLLSTKFSILTITHDRLFLQNVADRILELDRRNPQGLITVEGDYAKYLERKELLLTAQEQQEQSLRNKLRRETAWLRQGAKARSTKQKARIDRAADLADDVASLKSRNRSATARMSFQSADTTKNRLIEAKSVSKSYAGRHLFRKLNLLIHSRTRLGLLGRNGAGKSTLLRVLLGEEPPDEGTVKHSDQLSVAYFTQTRESLNPQMNMLEVLAPGGDHVFYAGKPVHVRSYLGRFLFAAEQMEMPCGRLSGGEQSRLLLAKLMLTQANLLVLDEPTNDLDIATLDVLQECLLEFNGAVLLVSHDRYFLDQVCDQLLAFEVSSQGGALTSYSSLEQWQQALDRSEEKDTIHQSVTEASTERSGPSTSEPRERVRTKRLSYNEQRELSLLPDRIEELERELAELEARCHSLAIDESPKNRSELYRLLAEKELEREKLYTRWSELDSRS